MDEEAFWNLFLSFFGTVGLKVFSLFSLVQSLFKWWNLKFWLILFFRSNLHWWHWYFNSWSSLPTQQVDHYSTRPSYVFWHFKDEFGSYRSLFWRSTLGNPENVPFGEFCNRFERGFATWNHRRWWKCQCWSKTVNLPCQVCIINKYYDLIKIGKVKKIVLINFTIHFGPGQSYCRN